MLSSSDESKCINSTYLPTYLPRTLAVSNTISRFSWNRQWATWMDSSTRVLSALWAMLLVEEGSWLYHRHTYRHIDRKIDRWDVDTVILKVLYRYIEGGLPDSCWHSRRCWYSLQSHSVATLREGLLHSMLSPVASKASIISLHRHTCIHPWDEYLYLMIHPIIRNHPCIL